MSKDIMIAPPKPGEVVVELIKRRESWLDSGTENIVEQYLRLSFVTAFFSTIPLAVWGIFGVWASTAAHKDEYFDYVRPGTPVWVAVCGTVFLVFWIGFVLAMGIHTLTNAIDRVNEHHRSYEYRHAREQREAEPLVQQRDGSFGPKGKSKPKVRFGK
jgi:hypothetical protein